jgi:hypothetical protein
MPLLNTPRFKRPSRGLLATAVVFASTLGGPVGLAGAGAPASHTGALAGPAMSNAALTVTPLVTDRLGTHAGEPLTPLGKKGDPTASRAGICDAGLYGGGFNTRLGSSWTSLTIRSRPCTGSSSNGSYGTSSAIYVSRETAGEFICRGRTYGYGSSIWFRTSRGYIWSGGTANPRWNRSC